MKDMKRHIFFLHKSISLTSVGVANEVEVLILPSFLFVWVGVSGTNFEYSYKKVSNQNTTIRKKEGDSVFLHSSENIMKQRTYMNCTPSLPTSSLTEISYQ